jgi:hypothetical protein
MGETSTQARDRAADEAGMVTAETAVVLPIIAAFVLVLLWLISVAVTEIRAIDAARDAARALARGADERAVRDAIADSAPPGFRMSVSHRGDWLTAAVQVTAEAPGWLLVPLPAIPLHASATAQTEPGVLGDG